MVGICKIEPAAKCSCLMLCLLLMLLSGCSSRVLLRARSDFYSGDYALASQLLSGIDKIPKRDRLLFLMEKGLILHHNGDYKESIQVLTQAVDLMEEQEVISVSQQTASLITTEWLTEYKGEYEERLLVHAYLMMNYLLAGEHEDALVEAKQALEIYDRYPSCSQDYFTRALIAHCYEAMGEINDAYIEYKKLAQFMPNPKPVAGKLFALASQLGYEDEVQEYRNYLDPAEQDSWLNERSGEMVAFVSQGRSPVKIPRNIILPPSIRFSFIEYESRTGKYIPPDVDRSVSAGSRVSIIITSDVGEVLGASVRERLKAILAKETARVVAKEAIANSANDKTLEAILRISFFLLEEPDTRSWQTLPAYMTLIVVPLNEGKNQIYINNFFNNEGGTFLSDIDAGTGNQKYYYYSIRN